MLEQLTVRDLVILKEAVLAPAPRLTAISGATGGGKTLVVLALRLLRGEKAKADVVRHGAKAASVDGVFRLSRGERSERVRELYEEVLGTEPEERIVVSRVIDASGRTRARIDGRPVTVRDLQRFGAFLIEVHGQGSNRSLMRPEIQTELLDAFCGLTDARRAFARDLAGARAEAERLAERRRSQRERRERAEFLRYCLGEIDAVDPEPGEHDVLLGEARIFENVDRMRLVLGNGVDLLHEGEAPVLEAIGALARDVHELTGVDPRLCETARVLDEAVVLLDDAARELRDGLSRLDLDPERQAAVTARLSDLDRLLERFGPSEAELLKARGAMVSELSELTEERSSEELETELAARLDDLAERGEAMTRERSKAARRLSLALVRELASLGMPDLRVEVRVEPVPGESLLERASELGTSAVEVFLAPNPGEPMTALRDTASGGEVARVMLVLKKILADADRVPVLVFDEADAEIGGRLGLAVGRKLREVAAKHQVLCVTHLPQIAAFADAHWLVDKRTQGKGGTRRTVSRLSELGPAERERELASMSCGPEAVDVAALAEAQRLLALASE